MFLNKISPNTIDKAKSFIELYSPQTYDYLKGNNYRIFYFYDVAVNKLSYVGICKNMKDCYLHLAEPYLAFSLTLDGELDICDPYMSYPLFVYLIERESTLSQEEMSKIYKEVYSINELVDGLTNAQAAQKIEDRKAFNEFISKIEKLQESEEEIEKTNNKLSVNLSFDYFETDYYENHLKFSILVIDNQKNYEIKDLCKFLNGFKQREEYSLSSKRKIILEPLSFISPYDRVLPLLANNCVFIRKTKVSSHNFPMENSLQILDLLQDEPFDFNGKRIKINIEEPASFHLDKDGVPHFTPILENNESIKSYIGKNGIYIFDLKKPSISFHQFPSVEMREAYKYFANVGTERFAYIQDIFAEKLLPQLSSSLKKKKDNGKDETKPFEIALYLSLDENSNLNFKTIYYEKGKETKKIETTLGQSMKTAYLSLLSSLGGVENGTLKNDAVVSFLNNDLSNLLNLVSFYCDERLKPNNITRSVTSLRLGAKMENGFLSLTLDSDKYSQEDLTNILQSFHQKKKYCLLKDGLVFLQGENLKEIATIFNKDDLVVDGVPLYKLFSISSSNISIDEDGACKNVLTSIRDFKDRPLNIESQINAKIRPYQKDGIKYLLSLHEFGFGGILADEMGLGKTLETIGYLVALEEKMPILVIAPKAVLYNWESEIHKFSNLECVVIDANRDSREKIIKNINQDKKVCYCISYDTFKRDEELFNDIKFSTIVLDEAQSIKNSLSRRHQSLLSLKAISRIALTGTPLENSPLDLWSIFDFLMPEYLGNEKDFEELLKNEGGDKRLATLLKPFMLRRRKDDVLKDLPNKTESNLLISMNESERMIYLAYLDKAREAQEKSSISVLASITRLRQLCVDPASFLENFPVSTKLLYAKDLLKETISNGHKAIVFSSFKTALLDLQSILEDDDIEVGLITGDTSGKDRLRLAEEFNTKDDIKVLLVSLKAGGVGLNLVGADTVIHLDPWWNPQVENQATDRVHRIGQTRPVTILRLIMKDTVEEKVLNLQEIKKDIYENIIEGNGGASSLSEEDIRYLLS